MSREALRVLRSEADRRGHEWSQVEPIMREVISIYGGWPVLVLYNNGILKNREHIPNLVSSYFIERELVLTFDGNLSRMKETR
jgi:hypothetical protein